jgi:hypothetical protein
MDGETDEKLTGISEEQEAKFAADREDFAAQSWYDIDPRLNTLLAPILGPERVDEHGSIELTVVVDGTVISGSAVSEDAWAKRQNAQISESSQFIMEVLEGVDESFRKQRTKAEEEAKANRLLLKQDQYLHFLEPVLLTGGTHVRMRATRVDLRSVSAWSIGRLDSGEK